MQEWIKELLVALGGGTAATIAILTIFKSLAVKLFEKAIDTSFEKSAIKLTNKLERSTKAYEILLKKEFDFYEKTDPYMATLVPLIQDLKHYAEQPENSGKEKYRELMLQYLQMIPKLKSDVVMFQPYIPEDVFASVSALLALAQENMMYLGDVGAILYEKQSGEINVEKMEEIQEKILLAIALVETKIKTRLTELSK